MILKICPGIRLCYIERNFGPHIKQGKWSVHSILWKSFSLNGNLVCISFISSERLGIFELSVKVPVKVSKEVV